MSFRALKEGLCSGLDSSLGRGGPSSSARLRMQPSSAAVQASSFSGMVGYPGGYVSTPAQAMGVAQLVPVFPLELVTQLFLAIDNRQHGGAPVRADIAVGSP